MTKLCKSRSAVARQSSSPERLPLEALPKSPTLFRLILHTLLCTAALILGFRLSREALLVVVSFKSSEGTIFSKSISNIHSISKSGSSVEIALRFPHGKEGKQSWVPPSSLSSAESPPERSSRVHVGRHEILIRPWPHPDPLQTLVAHRLMDLVQEEQRRSHGLKERKQLIIITPTYVRTFQAVHLTCLIHTLRVLPGPLTWIVVEAGGLSNETAELLSNSQLDFHHLGYAAAMPATWEEQWQLETLLRMEGLRFVRERRFDGIVLFADDSNTYTLEFFEEAQQVQWMGAFSIGVLEATNREFSDAAQGNRGASQSLFLQGPACNSTGNVIGWHIPVKNRSINGTGLFQSVVWASFALSSRVVWEERGQPLWIKTWSEWFKGNQTLIESPLDILRNASYVEPLGNCGRDVLMWWLPVEARTDSNFPPRWIIHPRLEVIVPSKRTPWLEASPEHLPPPTPPPPPPPQSALSISMTSDATNPHRKRKGKQGGRGGRGKRISHRVDSVNPGLDQGKT